MEIKRSRRVHLIVEESVTPEPAYYEFFGWNESAIVPEEVFDQLNVWKPQIGRPKTAFNNYDYAQAEKTVLVSLEMDVTALQESLAKATEAIKESALSVGNLIDAQVKIITQSFYYEYYGTISKYRWNEYASVFVTTPAYVNPFTKPYMADMRLRIFRPKLRSNHPRN